MGRKQEMELGRGGEGGLSRFEGALFHFAFLLALLRLCILITSAAKLSENSFLVLNMFLNDTGNVWVHSCCKRIKQYRSTLNVPLRKPPPRISTLLPWGSHRSWFSGFLSVPFLCTHIIYVQIHIYRAFFFAYMGSYCAYRTTSFFLLQYKYVLEMFASEYTDLPHSSQWLQNIPDYACITI